ncbi:MAG: transporter substrate-binding domain-containing protein, partial [Pantoea sp.]|nr:transporter substrate-binding domain-containing protein [Pantoea sp.]
VRTGNTDLQTKFNGALDKIKADGTYKTIYSKWFPQ